MKLSRRARVLSLGLLGVALLAVLVRWQLFQVLVIPTDSMQPYLYGDPEGGDRVLVYKKAFWRRAPERYEPVVFAPPRAPKDQYLVKRVVAFGGETLQIRDGDLYLFGPAGAAPEILAKSYADIQATKVKVFAGSAGRDLAESFDCAPELARPEGGELLMSAASDLDDALLAVRYRPVVDNGFVDALGDRTPGQHIVQDLLLRVVFVPMEEGVAFVAQLHEGLERFRFVLGSGPNRTRLQVEHHRTDGSVLPSTATLPAFVPEEPVQLEVWNIDETLGVAVDGVPVFTTRHRPVDRSWRPTNEGPRFGFLRERDTRGPEEAQASTRVLRIELYRDLYYTEPEGGDRSFKVPEGHFFVLGDHSADSVDSRSYGPISADLLIGRPVAVCLPWSRHRILE